MLYISDDFPDNESFKFSSTIFPPKIRQAEQAGIYSSDPAQVPYIPVFVIPEFSRKNPM
jgi:hypothetical protein